MDLSDVLDLRSVHMEASDVPVSEGAASFEMKQPISSSRLWLKL